jgi:hypothetical protein
MQFFYVKGGKNKTIYGLKTDVSIKNSILEFIDFLSEQMQQTLVIIEL